MASRQLGGEWTPRKVQKQVDVLPQGQSNVVDVTGTAESAFLAARLANTYTRAVVDLRRAQLRREAGAALERARRQLAALGGRDGSLSQELSTRITQLDGLATGVDPTLRFSEPATPPIEASGLGAPAIIVLALIAGLVIGTGLALARDLVAPRRLADEEAILETYPLPVLTRVPVLSRRGRRAGPTDAPPSVREVFRTLQVQLELTPGRHRSVAFTSASSGDGKTTSALNFALALAGAGREVVVIDFDLRKPDLTRRVQLDPRYTVFDVASDEVDLEDALLPLPGGEGVRVLCAASETRIVDLDRVSRRMTQIIDDALTTADYVVIDTPPLGEVADALKLAGLVDDLLIVSRLGHSNQVAFEAMRDVLERLRRPPSGYVLIGASPGLSGAYYHTYGDGDGGRRSRVEREPARSS